MKALLVVLMSIVLLGTSFAASPASVKGRTLAEVEVVPKRVLQRSTNPWFYRSLLVSPIEGYVVVQAELSGTKLYGARIARSDLGGAYDGLALSLADGMQIAGDKSIDSQVRFTRVRLHLLIYKVADGTMVLSFPSLERAGGDQADYYGCAKLAVLRADGKWVNIKGPVGLEGKGFEVRPAGIKNELASLLRLEHVDLNGSPSR